MQKSTSICNRNTLALHGYNWTIIFALLCVAWSITIILRNAFLPFMCLKAVHSVLKGLVKIQAAHFAILFLGEKVKLARRNLLQAK